MFRPPRARPVPRWRARSCKESFTVDYSSVVTKARAGLRSPAVFEASRPNSAPDCRCPAWLARRGYSRRSIASQILCPGSSLFRSVSNADAVQPKATIASAVSASGRLYRIIARSRRLHCAVRNVAPPIGPTAPSTAASVSVCGAIAARKGFVIRDTGAYAVRRDRQVRTGRPRHADIAAPDRWLPPLHECSFSCVRSRRRKRPGHARPLQSRPPRARRGLPLPERAGPPARLVAVGHAPPLARDPARPRSGRAVTPLESIGVDTWGCDYALLGEHGDLLENPYHYRDARTDGVMEAVSSASSASGSTPSPASSSCRSTRSISCTPPAARRRT